MTKAKSKKAKEVLEFNEASLLNRFVEYIAPWPDNRHRVAKVTELEKSTVVTEDKTTRKVRAVKVWFRLSKSRKVKRKDGTEYIKRYHETAIVPIERIRIVYLKADTQGNRRGIPFDEWCLLNSKDILKDQPKKEAFKTHYKTSKGTIACMMHGHRGWRSGKIGGYIRSDTRDKSKVTCKNCLRQLAMWDEYETAKEKSGVQVPASEGR